MSEPSGAMLSPEAAGARPLLAWSAPARERLSRAVEAAARQWEGAWGLPETERTGPAPAGDDHSDGAWLAAPAGAGPDPREWHAFGGARGLWWALSTPAFPGKSRAAMISSLSRALFGDGGPLGVVTSRGIGDAGHPSVTLATEVALAAWDDLGNRLGAALRGPNAPPAAVLATESPQDELRAWSGAIVLVPAGRDPSFSLLVSGDRVASFLGSKDASPRTGDDPRGPLTPFLAALALRTAPVRVQTSAFELELGVLASLRVGDVLRTSHVVDRPLAVSLAGSGETVSGAYLGRSGSQRAVELLPLPPATTPSHGVSTTP